MRILLIEDDVVLERLIAMQLRRIGYQVATSHSWNEAEQLLSKSEPAARAAAFKRILAIANEELPILPLYFPTSALITPKWMTGMYNPKRWGGVTLWIEDWRAR